MPSKKPSQEAFVFSWFKKHPNRPIPHSESKAAIEASYRQQYGERLEDSDRAIRKLGQEGKLIREAKGVYRYDPTHRPRKTMGLGFDAETRTKILKRDGYRCVVCGLGTSDGVELQVDHRIPQDKGGKGTLSNGQTLCGAHNYRKKNMGQIQFGKKLFAEWYKDLMALRKPNPEQTRLRAFCREILAVYKKHNIDADLEG
jgi:5-methylcytosine-specific restriction endonuclease McrA